MLTCGIMKQLKRPFSATVWREGDWYVSQCLDVDIASQGRTEEEALENLKEALALHFEPPCATHPPSPQTTRAHDQAPEILPNGRCYRSQPSLIQ
jgi:predicted RNase H-like HicB family nuclease